MLSVSHSSTVDKLYAWEKKLYLEVKVTTTKKLLFFFIFTSVFFLGLHAHWCFWSLRFAFFSAFVLVFCVLDREKPSALFVYLLILHNKDIHFCSVLDLFINCSCGVQKQQDKLY